MADTTFINENTVIVAEWLNDQNELYYRGGPRIKSLYEAESNTNAFTDAEQTKLTGIETAATADQTGAEIKIAYEAELNTNAFTDAEKTQIVTNTTNISENTSWLHVGVTAGGTVNAITANFTPDVTLTDRMTVVVRAIGANTSATVTFSPDGLTAKNVRKNGNRALVTGDVEGAGHELLLKYNSTTDIWELMNPARPDCVVEHEVAGSAVTSIDFTGLDINTDKSYRLEINFINAGAGSGGAELYYNNDTTSTNYNSQQEIINGTSITGVRINTGRIIYANSGEASSFTAFISAPGGYATCKSYGHYVLATINGLRYTQNKKDVTVTNITQLTLTADLSLNIGVGSKIGIYRG